jgi:glutathione S-transferase
LNFPFAGRAYPIRSAFKHAKIDFIDERITRAQLGELRGPAGFSSAVPLGSLPVLTLPDGRVITQSGAIARYVGRLAGLFPSDPLEALLVDEILDSFNDIGPSIPKSAGIEPEQFKALREEWANTGKLFVIFNFYSNKLAANNNGPYLVGNSLSVADFYLYMTIKMFRSGFWDHVPTDYDSRWPNISAYFAGLESNPVFEPYKY